MIPIGKRRRSFLICGILLFAAAGIFVFLHLRLTPRAGLFSWKSDVLAAGAREALFDCMEKQELTELYQYISPETEADTVKEFLRAAAKRSIPVYLLAGEPEWGLDESGAAICVAVERTSAYNAGLEEASRLRGVLIDAEPYLIDEWEENSSSIMKSYVSAMTRAYAAAEAEQLELIACIPYFYDELGYQSELDSLVHGGCHTLAIMNYNKEKEAVNIENEAALAQTYQRPLITIYELQAPGIHDLKERNTYYHDGIDAVRESWKALRKKLEFPQLSYALHEYQALQEVSNHE